MVNTEPKTVNPAGDPKITDTTPKWRYKRSPEEDRGAKDEPNPRHYEDFNRLLRGMARSSE
jgi:hypothetical protein